jgi:predicted dinucleotide-binding enzyme
VAKTLGSGFLKHGHSVKLGTRTASQLDEWVAANPDGSVGSFADAAEFGEAVVLAVKGSVASDVLSLAGRQNLSGKPILDATNPIADAPPSAGVLSFFTKQNESLLESLQAEFESAHFVKVFNSVGSYRMVNPVYEGGKPTMFICGNDEPSKALVAGILDEFGWETADMGTAEAARAIEPLCILWCIPGFRQNQWTHAFKLLK